MSKEQSSDILGAQQSNFRAGILFTAATLLILAIAQVVVAAGFFATPTDAAFTQMPRSPLSPSLSEAVIFTQMARWQILQQFVGCVALWLLVLTDEHPRSAIARGLVWVVGAGILSVALENFGVPYCGIGLIVVVLLVALRQMMSLARAGAAIHIEQLWRIVAVQWLLLWAGADGFLRFRHSAAGTDSSARSLLFLLPAVGLLPNVLMSVTIRLRTLLDSGRTVPRLRAWLLSLVALNVGAILTVAGPSRLGVLGLPLMLLAIVLFLVGFPKHSFRGGTFLLPLTFVFLALPLVLLLLERIKLATSSDPVPFFYSESWRHLLIAVPALWLLAVGMIAHKKLLPAKIQSPGLALMIPLLFLGGVVLTGVFLFAATFSHDLTQGLIIGAVLELLALLMAVPLALRSMRASRKLNQ